MTSTNSLPNQQSLIHTNTTITIHPIRIPNEFHDHFHYYKSQIPSKKSSSHIYRHYFLSTRNLHISDTPSARISCLKRPFGPKRFFASLTLPIRISSSSSASENASRAFCTSLVLCAFYAEPAAARILKGNQAVARPITSCPASTTFKC